MEKNPQLLPLFLISSARHIMVARSLLGNSGEWGPAYQEQDTSSDFSVMYLQDSQCDLEVM